MMPTQDESAALKGEFKRHFRMQGYNAPLPPDLESKSREWPLDYGEACAEFERWGVSA